MTMLSGCKHGCMCIAFIDIRAHGNTAVDSKLILLTSTPQCNRASLASLAVLLADLSLASGSQTAAVRPVSPACNLRAAAWGRQTAIANIASCARSRLQPCTTMSAACMCASRSLPAAPSSWCPSVASRSHVEIMPNGNVPTTSLIGGPAPASARQGRHKQRYGETGERLVAG